MNIATLIAAVVLGPLAQEPAAAPAHEIVRLGDNQMTCEALIGEINALNGEMLRIQGDMSDSAMDMTREGMPGMGGGLGGAAMSLGSMAASFIPGADMLMGTIGTMAVQAQMANQQNRMMEEVDAMTAAGAAMGPISGRIEHLSEISRRKSC